MTTTVLDDVNSLRPLRVATNGRIRSIYLSGPMTGYPEHNYPAFRYAAASLRREGHTVYNPSEYGWPGLPELFPVREAFAAYSDFICTRACSIVLLPGWHASLGVSAELALARNCRLDILAFYPTDPVDLLTICPAAESKTPVSRRRHDD